MFMQELQYLFALMMGSNRKFVDPSAALDLLKGAFRSPEEQQVQKAVFACFPLKFVAFKIITNNTIILLYLNSIIDCELD